MLNFINLPNLVALLILFLGIASFSRSLLRQNTSFENILVTSQEDFEVESTKLERVELVIFNPNSQGPFNPSFVRDIEVVNLQVLESDSRRLEAILAALRKAMSIDQACQDLVEDCNLKKTLWPKSLLTPQVFVTSFVSDRPIAILNFGLDHPVQISAGQEQALLNSINETLNRNGLDSSNQLTDTYILINSKVSPTFLGHVALVTALN